MPTVPIYGNGVTQVRPSPVEAPRATPDSFGAIQGRQLQELGQAVQGAGEGGLDVMRKRQERENLDAVFRAETSLKNASTAFSTEMKKRKGQNAKGVLEDATRFWDDQLTKGRDGLANNAQKAAFDKVYQQHRTAGLGSAAEYESVEEQRALGEAAKANIEAAVEDGIANPGAADLNIERIDATTRAYGALNGLPPEAVDAQIAKSRTAMHAGVIKSLVDTNPGAARKYYNQYKDQVLPSDRDAIEDSLRAGETKGFAQRKASDIMARYPGDYQKQLDTIRDEVKDPDRQAAAVAEVRARQAEKELNKGRTEQQAKDDTYQFIADAGRRGKPIVSVNDIPDALWQGMSGTDRENVASHLATIAANAGGPPKVTDRQKQIDLERAIEEGQVSRPEHLLYYEPYLTKGDYDNAKKKLEAAGKIDQTKLRQAFENRFGSKRDTWVKDNDQDAIAEWNMFQENANRGVEDRTYNNDQINKMVDDWFINNARPWKRDTTLGKELTTNPHLIDQSVGVYTMATGGGQPASRGDVVSAARVLSQLGYELTPTNLGLAVALAKTKYGVTRGNMEKAIKKFEEQQ